MSDLGEMKIQNTNNRLKGKFPKVGIRPAIDGRLGGVRESLEDQVMDMAKAAATFISENLKYSNGSPVECVIADTCIGGVAESALCAEKFDKEGVGVSLTVTPCWCYGSETMDMNPLTPKAIWGFNGTERPGAVYLAAVLAAHAQKGLPAFGIYGRDVQDKGDKSIPADVQEKILRFTKAGLAAAQMKGTSYLSIGGVSMGIAGSIVDANFFQDYLGMRNEYIESVEIIRRIEKGIYDKDEYEKALQWVKANCTEGEDGNYEQRQYSREDKDDQWEFCVKTALIARDLMIGNEKLAQMGYGEEAQGHNAIAAGFQGQRQWTDTYPNGDFLETMLNTSFDWNGIREPFLMATENDCLNGVSMLFGKLLTNTAQLFSDVRTYWSPEAVERVTGQKPEGAASNGFIHLINSGSTTLDATGRQEKDGKPILKPFWEISKDEVQACLDNTKFIPADIGYFPGGGFSTNFTTREGMPMTMCRINLVKGIGPVLQIAEGESIELPKDMHDVLDQRTSPGWPTTWFVPRLTGKGAFRDVYTVMANWGANHGAISYGHIGSDLIALAAILRIPVNMHNVAEEDVFRPATWSGMGTADSESADYRACENFGPLYR